MEVKNNKDLQNISIGLADYEWAVGLNRHTMKMIGVWPEERSGKKKILNDIHVTSLVSLMLFGLLLPQLYALTMVINELSLVADNITPSVASMISMAKLILLRLHQKNLRFVMASIKYDYLQQKDDWEREIMLTEAKRGRFYTTCGYFMLVCCISGVLFGPLMGFSFRIKNNITDRGDRYFPDQTYYPYDFEKSPYFEMTYAIQLFSITITTVSYSSPVTFYNAIVLHNCGRLTVLGTKINALIAHKDSEAFTYNGRSYFQHQMKMLVDSHIRIIKVVGNIEITYKNMILAHVFGLSTMICCLGFQMLIAIDNIDKSSTTLQILMLSVMLSTVLWHTFVYSYAGEKLITHCEELGRSIYGTKWYSWQSKQSMSLLLMMIRTKDPLQLTAGKVASLNIQMFARILKSSAGYISMLLTVRNK